jgi:hypothetical protein
MISPEPNLTHCTQNMIQYMLASNKLPVSAACQDFTKLLMLNLVNLSLAHFLFIKYESPLHALLPPTIPFNNAVVPQFNINRSRE